MASMNVPGAARRSRVVKTYGRDSLLVWMNLLISALQASLGLRVGLRSEAEVLRKMEEDSLKMAERGYRVVSADQYDLPLFANASWKATYYKVTYELIEDPNKRLSRS